MGREVLKPKRHARDRQGKNETAILPSHQKIEVFNRSLLGWYANNGRQYLWREETATLYHKIVA
jgi:hypothetical protein